MDCLFLCSKPKSIKLTYGGCNRRITMTQPLSSMKFQDLITAARTLFPELANQQNHRVFFSYEDNEKDIIHLDSDEELQEAFQCQLSSHELEASSSPSPSLLRFHVHCPTLLSHHQIPIEYHNNPLHTLEQQKSKEIVGTMGTTMGTNDAMGGHKKSPLGLLDNSKLLDLLESDLLGKYPSDLNTNLHSCQQIEDKLNETMEVSLVQQPMDGEGVVPLVATAPVLSVVQAETGTDAPAVMVMSESTAEQEMPVYTVMKEQEQGLESGLGEEEKEQGQGLHQEQKEQEQGPVEEGALLPVPEETTFYSTTLYSTVDMNDDDGLTALTLDNDPEIKDYMMLYGRSTVEDGDGVMVTASMQEEVEVCEPDQCNAHMDKDDDIDWLSRDEHLTTTVVQEDVNDVDKVEWHKVDTACTVELTEHIQHSPLSAEV